MRIATDEGQGVDSVLHMEVEGQWPDLTQTTDLIGHPMNEALSEELSRDIAKALMKYAEKHNAPFHYELNLDIYKVWDTPPTN